MFVQNSYRQEMIKEILMTLYKAWQDVGGISVRDKQAVVIKKVFLV